MLSHRVRETPLGVEIEQHLEAPGVEDLVLRFRPRGKELVVEGEWTMSRETHPEATYLAFPFAVQDPRAHVDVGGQAVRVGRDQIGRCCRDYYTAQRWVDGSGPEDGVTVGCPLNPLVQFGDFNFGANLAGGEPESGLLLGWVTNNYWQTNFRAHQPGRVRARYHLRPHDGFEETRAHRAGFEAEQATPAVQTLAEPPVEAPPLGASGRLLDLPEPPVLVLQVQPAGATSPGRQFGSGAGTGDAAGDGDVRVLLRNASDRPHTATLGSGLLTVERAGRGSVLGGPVDRWLPVDAGEARLEMDARETALVALDCSV